MTYFFIIILSIIFCQGYNPCEDKRYLTLKNKPLIEMNDREYDYFIKYNRDCIKYLESNKNISNQINIPTTSKIPEEGGSSVYKGPRFGITYLGAGIETENRDIEIKPTISQFGWQYENRIFGDTDKTIGLMEYIFLFGGAEQGYLLPSMTAIAGIRNRNGFEFGFGPNISLSGVGYVLAFGVVTQSGGLVIPHNISFAFSQDSFRISYITGFNSFTRKN